MSTTPASSINNTTSTAAAATTAAAANNASTTTTSTVPLAPPAPTPTLIVSDHSITWLVHAASGLLHPVMNFTRRPCFAGHLRINVMQVRDLLRKKDKAVDTYVELSIGKQVRKTHPVKSDGSGGDKAHDKHDKHHKKHPGALHFDSWVDFELQPLPADAPRQATYLKVVILDHTRLSNTRVAKTKIPLRALLQMANPTAALLLNEQKDMGSVIVKPHTAWFELMRDKDHQNRAGFIELTAEFSPNYQADTARIDENAELELLGPPSREGSGTIMTLDDSAVQSPEVTRSTPPSWGRSETMPVVRQDSSPSGGGGDDGVLSGGVLPLASSLHKPRGSEVPLLPRSSLLMYQPHNNPNANTQQSNTAPASLMSATLGAGAPAQTSGSNSYNSPPPLSGSQSPTAGYSTTTLTKNDKKAFAAAQKKQGKNKKVKIFGGRIADAVEVSEHRVPAVMYETTEFLRAHGLQKLGLFRVPGRSDHIQQLKAAYDKQETPTLTDPHNAGGVLKLYLRELAEPLIPFPHYEHFMNVTETEKDDPERCVEKYKVLLASIPQVNRDCLDYLVWFLSEVAAQAHVNKMEVKNLAIVFAPNLLRPEVETQASMIGDAMKTVACVTYLIEYHEVLFPHGGTGKLPSASNIAAQNNLLALASHHGTSHSLTAHTPTGTPTLTATSPLTQSTTSSSSDLQAIINQVAAQLATDKKREEERVAKEQQQRAAEEQQQQQQAKDKATAGAAAGEAQKRGSGVGDKQGSISITLEPIPAADKRDSTQTPAVASEGEGSSPSIPSTVAEEREPHTPLTPVMSSGATEPSTPLPDLSDSVTGGGGTTTAALTSISSQSSVLSPPPPLTTVASASSIIVTTPVEPPTPTQSSSSQSAPPTPANFADKDKQEGGSSSRRVSQDGESLSASKGGGGTASHRTSSSSISEENPLTQSAPAGSGSVPASSSSASSSSSTTTSTSTSTSSSNNANEKSSHAVGSASLPPSGPVHLHPAPGGGHEVRFTGAGIKPRTSIKADFLFGGGVVQPEKKCPKCSYHCPLSSKFCQDCGAKFVAAPMPMFDTHHNDEKDESTKDPLFSPSGGTKAIARGKNVHKNTSGKKLDAKGLEQYASDFIEMITEEPLEGKTFWEALRDGSVLCNLVNKLRPGSIKKIHQGFSPFQQMENINLFLGACTDVFGLRTLELFSAIDLHDGKNMRAVVNTILALERAV